MKALYIQLIALLFLLIPSACQKKDPIPSPHKLRLNLRTEPASLDPRKVSDLLSFEIQVLLFEGLMRCNPDGTLDLGQACAVDISQDRCRYTFHLRDALWSDGSPVTAYDFEHSWKEILDPSFPAPNAHLFYPIKHAEAAKKGLVPRSEVGISAQDAHTLIVTLEQPTPYFLDLTSFIAYAPTHRANTLEHPDWAYDAGEHFLSNGPYTLKEWKHNNELLVSKNPLFWDQAKIPCNEIHFTMIEDETTILQLFEHKELDIAGGPLCSLPVEAARTLRESGKLSRKPIGCTTLIAFNTQHPPFTNIHIRTALSLALNREEIVEHITQLGELPALNAIPPILKKNQNIPLFQDADLKEAQTQFTLGLEELGMSAADFPPILYLYSATDLHDRLAQTIQQQWHKAFGITVNLQAYDPKILMTKLIAKEFTVAQTIWIAQFQDPVNILERFKFKDHSKNYCAWEHPEFIHLLDRSATEMGLTRAATLQQAEALFIHEMPVAPIYHWQHAFLVQPELSNLKICTSGSLYFSPESS